MLSGFFSDILGVLWVKPALVEEINQHRADFGKPPLKIFQIASQAAEEEPGARKQRGIYDDDAIAKGLVLLNEERAMHGQDPTSPEWLSSLGAFPPPLLPPSPLSLSPSSRSLHVAAPPCYHHTSFQLLPFPTFLFTATVKFDYGKNREGIWRAKHMLEHLDEFMEILSVMMPGFQHFFVFDNSPGHGAFAPDALVASKLNRG
jgi:hypothetical protein